MTSGWSGIGEARRIPVAPAMRTGLGYTPGVRQDFMAFSEAESGTKDAGQDPARALGSVAMAATAMGAMTAAACRRATKPRRVSALLDGDEGWAAGDGVLVS